jgi:hydroxyacyl-ACP dehydratase HTD2-like protein with hotdog domain
VHTPSRVWDVPSADPKGFVERHMRWSPVALFGFSALTFNAHKIHYSESWTREVEGHPGLVVHGPMNLINMLDYWRDVHGAGDSKLRLRAIDYRATAPIYAGEEYRIVTSAVEEGREPKYSVRVMKGEVVCMRGNITAERE